MARESFATAKDLGVKSCDTWLNKCDIEVAGNHTFSTALCVIIEALE